MGIPYVDAFGRAKGPFEQGILKGYHMAWSVPDETIHGAAPYIQTIKGLVGTGDKLRLAKAINPGVVTIYRDYRSGVECPSLEDLNNPSGYYQRLLYYWSDAGVLDGSIDYFEVMNEMNNHVRLEPHHYDALSDFSIGLAELMAKDGLAMLACSFGPGNPHTDVFHKLVPYFRWADTHPAGKWWDGSYKFHGLAMHSAGFMPPWVDTKGYDWINNIWIAGRHRLYAEKTFELERYVLSNFKGPIFITELGWTYGYAEKEGEDVFALQELQAGVQETTRQYGIDNIVSGFHIWNVGSGPTNWLNYAKFMPDLFKI